MCKVKRILAALATLLGAGFATTSTAQPVLTPDNSVLPLLGQEITLSQYRATSPGSLAPVVTATGENMVWDFSNADFGTAVILPVGYLEPPFTGLPGGGAALFQNANYAFSIDDVISEDVPDSVEVINYFIIDDSQLTNLGFAARVDADEDGDLDEVTVTFDPAEVEMIFPLTMGTKWDSESSQTFNVEGIGSFPGSTVSTSNEVVGWGTLITPDGSAQVLQINQFFTASFFGVVAIESRSIQFFGPLQETAGKRALQSISADVEFDGDGSITEVRYSVFEADGGAATAAEDLAEVPSGLLLHPNYPNPFNPATTFPFSVETSGRVLMTVHDVLGREVDVVVDGILTAGSHAVTWEAGQQPSGVYQVRLSMDGQIRTRSIVLQK